ncbi:MAG: PH domain-containing protein [Actinophytocola sp.]|nr:PH domain-containing protein [Actinophytocola sp.]
MGNTVRLRPPNNQLNRRCLLWWRAWIALVVLPIVGALAIVGLLVAPVLTVLAGIAAAGGLAYGVIMPLWWFRVHRWEVTDTAVYTRTGYFWQESRIAPMSRIQTVDTVRGPLQQLLRLATVTVTTASAKGAVRIVGLDAELAADLAAELTRITQATPGDAT